MESLIEKTHKRLIDKEISAVKLTEEYLLRIKERDPDIHAFLSFDEKRALAAAQAVDERIAAGEEIGLLAGIPLAVKDNILIKGTTTTAGSRILETYQATYDAHVIAQLRREGAVFLGKTNMDEFAMGSSTENSAFGPTKNPRNLLRVPGGSSGGSAAAVAAEECIAALGSDTGGSIRQPAAFCGVVGLKPTYGAVSRSGVIAMASSLDQIGPIAGSVRDAEILFHIIRGHDPMDSTSLISEEFEEVSDTRLRIGLPKEYFADGLDPHIAKNIRDTVERLGSRMEIKEISLPHTTYALASYYVIMPAEVSSNLARFDGIRYGKASKADTLLERYIKTRSEGFGREVRRRIILGTHVLSSGYYDAYYGRAQKVRTLVAVDFKNAFEDVDLIVTPTAPSTAFALGEKVEDPLTMYLSDIYTVPINLAGVPAISVPAGEVEGLPVGIQFISSHHREDLLFAIGKMVEESR